MNIFKYYARLQLIYTIIYAQFGAKITIDSFMLIYRKLQIDVMCTSCFFKIWQASACRAGKHPLANFDLSVSLEINLMLD